MPRRYLVRAVRRRFWIPLLCAFVAGAGSYAVAAHSPPKYDAAAFLRLGDPHVLKDALGIPEGTPIENALVAIPARVHRPETARRAAELLKGDLELTPAEVLAQTKSTIDGGRGLVVVGARADTPVDAARLANAMTDAYLQLGPRQDLRRIHRVRVRLQGLARRQATHASSDPEAAINLSALQDRIDHLRAIEAVRPESVTLDAAAGPPAATTGISPREISLLGAVLGLLIGVAAVALTSYRSDGIGDPRELAFLLQAPVLSEIPETRKLQRRTPLAELEPEERWPFRQILNRLDEPTNGGSARSLAVTSPAEGNGASTTAWYLAAIVADDGARTLLLRTEPYDSMTSGANGAFDVAVAERGNGLARRPGGPLSSRERGYDAIIIEAPAASRAAAAIPLMLDASRVVVVCRAGLASREQVENLRNTFDELGISPLGVVAVGFG